MTFAAFFFYSFFVKIETGFLAGFQEGAIKAAAGVDKYNFKEGHLGFITATTIGLHIIMSVIALGSIRIKKYMPVLVVLIIMTAYPIIKLRILLLSFHPFLTIHISLHKPFSDIGVDILVVQACRRLTGDFVKSHQPVGERIFKFDRILTKAAGQTVRFHRLQNVFS